jgi:hypothetical protein
MIQTDVEPVSRVEFEDAESAAEPKRDGTFLEGMLLLAPVHLLQIPMSLFVYQFSFLFIGATQLVYVVPLLFLLNAKKRTEMMQGVAAAAAITFMLNATCASILFFVV